MCAPQLTVVGVLVGGCLFLSVAAGAQASPILPNNGKWRLTWSDEFNEPMLAAWIHRNGLSRWAQKVGGTKNGSTTRVAGRTHTFGDGDLVIEARGELHGNRGCEPKLQGDFFCCLTSGWEATGTGNPDTARIFPQTMLVDHVRVYQRSSE